MRTPTRDLTDVTLESEILIKTKMMKMMKMMKMIKMKKMKKNSGDKIYLVIKVI